MPFPHSYVRNTVSTCPRYRKHHMGRNTEHMLKYLYLKFFLTSVVRPVPNIPVLSGKDHVGHCLQSTSGIVDVEPFTLRSLSQPVLSGEIQSRMTCHRSVTSDLRSRGGPNEDCQSAPYNASVQPTDFRSRLTR